MRARTAPGMPPGRLWRSGDRHATSTPGRVAVTSTSSRASAPQPMTRVVPRAASSLRCGTTLVDEAAGRFRSDARIAAVRVGADGQPELLVQGRAADQHDVLLAHPAVLER